MPSRKLVGDSRYEAVGVVRIGRTIAPLRVPLAADDLFSHASIVRFAVLAEEFVHLLRPGVGKLSGHAMPGTGFQLGIHGVVVVALVGANRVDGAPSARRHRRLRTCSIAGQAFAIAIELNVNIRVEALREKIEVILNFHMRAFGAHIADRSHYRFPEFALNIQTPALDVSRLPGSLIHGRGGALATRIPHQTTVSAQRIRPSASGNGNGGRKSLGEVVTRTARSIRNIRGVVLSSTIGGRGTG